MKKNLVFFLLLINTAAFSQMPVIQKVEPLVMFPKGRVLISGSGFSATPAQLQVWFDQVRGTIINSTEFSIEVEVPSEARLSNITVVNLVSRLSGQSRGKFMHSYSGEGFNATKLAPVQAFSSPGAVFDLITVDVDGDNKPDIIGSKNETTATNMMLLMNNSTIGNISFTNTSLAAFTLNAPTAHLAVGDLNGDGKPDLVASRSGATVNSVFVLGNTSSVGNPNFSAPTILNLDLTHTARQVSIADLNGDGKPEIIVTNSASTDLYIYKNESSGGTIIINPTPIKIAVTGSTKTYGLEVQDMDNDGKLDIVASEYEGPFFYVLKNESTPSSFIFNQVKQFTSSGDEFSDLATVDLNRDGKQDVIITSLFSTQAQIFLNQSTASTIAFTNTPITIPTDSQPFGVDVCDLNGDRFPDFIIPSRGANTVNAYIHNGNVSALAFTKVTINSTKTNWFVRAGDLDGDAKPDIAYTSFKATAPTSFTIDVLRNMNCFKPQILNEAPLFICPTQTIRLVSIPNPGVTFDWSNGVASIKNSADPFVLTNIAATYSVKATGEGGNCVVTSAPLIIQSGAGTLPADPAITTNSPICVGTALTLSTPTISGATYSWTGPNNFTSNLSNISISNATIANAGIYSLTVKVGDCSSNAVTKRVDVVSFGSFAITSTSPTNTVCQGQTITLSINSESGYTYQWIKDGTNITGQTSTALAATQEGTYKVKVTNTVLGCSQETAPLTVTVLTAPVASYTVVATACANSNVAFTNTSTIDSRALTIYAWNFGDSETSSDASPTHTYTTAQNFNSQLTVSYSGVPGCTNVATKSITISNAAAPIITSSVTELCATGETTTLSVTGTFSSYLWNTNGTAASLTITTPGTYSVATVDGNGCQSSDDIIIAEKTDCSNTTELKIPLTFTPNGDQTNDKWVIPGIETLVECTMAVFDGRGRRVFEITGYPQSPDGWDGTFEGKEVPKGTYYYVLGCPNAKPVTGSVLVVR